MTAIITALLQIILFFLGLAAYKFFVRIRSGRRPRFLKPKPSIGRCLWHCEELEEAYSGLVTGVMWSALTLWIFLAYRNHALRVAAGIISTFSLAALSSAIAYFWPRIYYGKVRPALTKAFNRGTSKPQQSRRLIIMSIGKHAERDAR